MTALRAETAKLGAAEVKGSNLYFGDTKASNDLVRAVKKEHGVAASIFVKSGDQYTRVATTVKKEGGSNAVGTALDANSPAIAKLNSGESLPTNSNRRLNAAQANVWAARSSMLIRPIAQSRCRRAASSLLIPAMLRTAISPHRGEKQTDSRPWQNVNPSETEPHNA